MKSFVRYMVVFVLGFIACAFTLRQLYGTPIRLSGGFGSRQAALTRLASAPLPVPSSSDESPIAMAAARVEPAVVDVHTEGKPVSPAPNPFRQDPFFRRFFGEPDDGDGAPSPIVPRGAGSGFLISPDGYILTNNHVVANADRVTVKVGGDGYTARVIGTDEPTDIAVVKIDPKGKRLPVAELGDSSKVKVGDWAIAVGNPLDIGTTVTLGIISAINRKDLAAEGHPLGSVIQTDAAINPGNSGGALANIRGEVIGVNEAIYSPTGASIGIGFAIPINVARKIATELIEKGKVVRPYIGISYVPLKEIPRQAREQVGIPLKGDDGLVIQQVYPNSPASRAGLRLYDVIIEVNRKPIRSPSMLNDLMETMKIGSVLTFLVSREGQNRIVTVTLQERPSRFGATQPMPEGGGTTP